MNLHDYLQTLELLIKYPASYDEMRSSSLKISNSGFQDFQFFLDKDFQNKIQRKVDFRKTIFHHETPGFE